MGHKKFNHKRTNFDPIRKTVLKKKTVLETPYFQVFPGV